jgi:hypothetical protein
MSPQSVRPRARGRVRRAARVVLPSCAAAIATSIAFAAFTDEAANSGNQASAASVTITEDVAATSPLFALHDWQPGEQDTVARCIAVKNDGSIALPLTMRFDGAPAGELGDYVDMTIERGTRAEATDSADCSTFEAGGVVFEGELDEFPPATGDGVSDRAGALAPAAERAYRVTWHLQDTEDAEGKSISGVDFLWETTSAG